MEFKTIILTETGDFMLENESELQREEKGVEIENPWVINEEEKAQEVQANEIFIPYNSLQNIQYGNFQQETVE